MIDCEKIKMDFPIFLIKKDGQSLVYLDSAATSQKPITVIKAIKYFYENLNANVHRGIYQLSEGATLAYTQTRENVAKFIGAETKEIIFVRNATEAANLIAYSYGEIAIREGDEIIISELEHHSNFVPWLALAKRKKAKIKIWEMQEGFAREQNEGLLNLEDLKKLLLPRTKILALTQMSNVLGVIPPFEEAIKLAHEVGAKVVLDCAQGISHLGINVKQNDVDFAFASGHKMFAGTGIGFLFGKKELLEKMPPFLSGGGMVKEIEDFDFETLELPMKFEAGTPDIAGVISLKAAMEYLNQFQFREILEHDRELRDYLISELQKFHQIKIFGPLSSENCGGILPFSIEGIHPHDIASICDQFNVAVRAGHHCAKPLNKKLGVDATVRVSFHIYNSKQDVDQLIEALNKVIEIFK